MGIKHLGVHPSQKPRFGQRLDRTHPHAAGLVLAYLCNEGAGGVLRNQSASGDMDATLNTGSPSWTRTPTGTAAVLDGSTQSFQAPFVPSLSLTRYTVEARLTLATLAQNQMVLDVVPGSGETIYLWWNHNTGFATADSWVFGYVTGGGASDHVWTPGGTMDTKEHTIAYTVDGSNVKFYFDGQLVSTINQTNTPVAGSGGGTVYVGQRYNSISGFWNLNGSVTHLRVWDHAKTGDELADLYQEPYGALRAEGAPRFMEAHLPPMLYDRFTDTAGTTLASHTADSGNTWALHSFSSGTAAITPAARARTGGGDDGWYVSSWTPDSADYTVEADLYVATAQGIAGLLARFSASALTGYRFIYHQGLGGWYLDRLSGGSALQIGSTVAVTLTVGQSYHLKLVLSGTSLSAYVDGTLVISGTNGDITAAGQAGLLLSTWTGSFNYSTGDGIGVQLDNLTAGGVLFAATGLATAEAIGTANLTLGASTLAPTGLASAGGIGQPNLATSAFAVAPAGLASGQAFGVPGLRSLQTLAPAGLASAEGIGQPDLRDAGRSLKGFMRVAADAVRTLGGYAYVTASSLTALLGYARAAATPSPPVLGGYARAAEGPVLNGFASVAAAVLATLKGYAQVILAGSKAGNFFPADGRRFADAERQYLQIMYRNYPLSSQTADLRWQFDDVVLPVNGISLELKEPVRETVLNTLAARVITVIEEELDTPRVTRSRQFVLTFPPLGVQVLQFMKNKMRVGQEFYADFRLMDVLGEAWERLYTDLSDPDFTRKRYWGTLPYWKPGTVRVRVNGVEISDFSDGAVVVNPTMGFVEFFYARHPADRVEVQYAYCPRVRLMEIDSLPKTGHAFSRFGPQVTLVELTPLDPNFGRTPLAASTTTFIPPPPAGYADSFNRADGPATTLDTGQAWVRTGSVLAAAKLQIAGMQAFPGAFLGSGNDNAYTVVTDATDGFVSAQVWQNGDAGFPALLGRYSAATGMYELVYEFDNGFLYPTYHLYRNLYGAGGRTELWRGGYGQHREGDTWGLKFAGTTISVLLNGVLYAQVTDSNPVLAANTAMGVRVTGNQVIDNFSFRRVAEYYSGLFLPNPNGDWLTGSPVSDDFAKPDGGLGFAATGQGWLNADDFYPTAIANLSARGAVGGLVLCNAADGVVEVHGGQFVANDHAPYVLMRAVQAAGVRTSFLWFGLTGGTYQILAFQSNTYSLIGGAPTITGPVNAPVKLEVAGSEARGWALLSGVWTLVYTGTIPSGLPSSALHGFGINDANNFVSSFRFSAGPVVP